MPETTMRCNNEAVFPNPAEISVQSKHKTQPSCTF